MGTLASPGRSGLGQDLEPFAHGTQKAARRASYCCWYHIDFQYRGKTSAMPVLPRRRRVCCNEAGLGIVQCNHVSFCSFITQRGFRKSQQPHQTHTDWVQKQQHNHTIDDTKTRRLPEPFGCRILAGLGGTCSCASQAPACGWPLAAHSRTATKRPCTTLAWQGTRPAAAAFAALCLPAKQTAAGQTPSRAGRCCRCCA